MDKRIQLYSGFGFALMLPINTKISNLLLGILMFTLLIECIRNKYYKEKINPSILFQTTLFILFLLLLGFIDNQDGKAFFKYLGRYSSYLFAPLILMTFPLDSLKKIAQYAFKGVIGGLIISFAYLHYLNLSKYFKTHTFPNIQADLLNYYHTYFEFTEPIGIHPSYLGIYTILGLVVLISFNKTKSFLNNMGHGLIFLFLMVSIVFLNSRITLLLSIIPLILFTYSNLNHYLPKQLVVYIGVALFMIAGLFSYKLVHKTYFYQRITHELYWELSDQKNTEYSANNTGDSRIARWKEIVKLIQEKPLLGYGNGEEKKQLENIFLENNLVSSAKNQYDSHNQYLSFLIEYGSCGLIVYLVFLISNLYIHFKTKNWLFLYTVISIVSIGLIENFLKNNAGIIFIAFFMNLFYFISLKQHATEN